MALFQSAVLNNYLNSVDDSQVEDAWNRFTDHFHNPEIQENIRNSKEEEYQDGFLSDLFVNVLGYTKYPAPGYNLKVEQRDEKGSKKSDGALYVDDKVAAVIELKGTDTTDLDKVESQAFGYKNYHRHADYVIISNFEKLRFYIDNAVEHIEFNLFKLSKEEFKILWLCLEHGNLSKGLPKKIKESSLTQNEEITKKLYADYSAFKDAIFKSIVKHNPDYDKLHLFKKTQKLLDRFLFIFFAEDQQLLPANSIKLIIQEWQQLRDLDEYRPLYDRFVKYFGYLNTGRTIPGKVEIFAYNGGLFEEDPILDTIVLDDEILYKHTLQLSKYNFASEVDVNILGHIFEHSLNEIEEITAELEGQKVDRSKTRRKKDGVYYTPKYITQYIVENTVGKLCEEKKAELQIEDEEYRPNRQKTTKKKLLNNLETYREWLLKLTICDPACGSGAFLNQALEFLLNEHHYIDELQAKLLEESIVYPDIEASILENNLYGVDINEESVEIAKLSLWLRTAQKGRKLTSLNNHIKCGNSLIDDPEVAGEKAFKWEEEFPSVFKNGGFDVVIGNPPYVNINSLSEDVLKYFGDNYSEIHTGYNDLMYYFLFKGINMVKAKGSFGMITSNYFIGNEYAKKLRGFLSQYISSILNFVDYQIFEDANIHTALIFANKFIGSDLVKYHELSSPNKTISDLKHRDLKEVSVNRNELKDYWIFTGKEKSNLLKKVELNSISLGSITEIEKGSTTGRNSVFTISREVVVSNNIENDLLRKNVKNGDIGKYYIFDRGDYLIYTDGNTEIKNYPNTLNYLLENKDSLSKRNEVKKGRYPWWRLERPRRKDFFDSEEKIIVPYRATENRFAYDNDQRFNDGGDVRIIVITDNNFSIKYVLGLLNSRLLNWYYGFIGKPKGNSREYFNEPLSKIPIANPKKDFDEKIIKAVERIIDLKSECENIQTSFSELLLSKFDIEKLSRKLDNWDELTFKQFLNELKKKKVSLSLSEEAEWMDYFNRQKAKTDELKIQIAQKDKEIDGMVYDLYGLSEEEVRVVEGDNNKR